MRVLVTASIACLVGTLGSSARAQPGLTPPAPPPGYGRPPPTVMLTADEQELLRDGEISDFQQGAGIVAAVFVGLGTGQAIEGRYTDTGYLFTLGEAASGLAFFYGLARSLEDCVDRFDSCPDNHGDEWLIAGLIGATVFRVWGVIDAAAGPGAHNRRVRALRQRLEGVQPVYTRLNPYVLPAREGGGAVAGVGFTF